MRRHEQAIFKGILEGLGASPSATSRRCLPSTTIRTCPRIPSIWQRPRPCWRRTASLRDRTARCRRRPALRDHSLGGQRQRSGNGSTRCCSRCGAARHQGHAAYDHRPRHLFAPPAPISPSDGRQSPQTANNPDPDDSLYWISTGIPKSPTDATCCNSRAYFHRFDFQAQIDALYRGRQRHHRSGQATGHLLQDPGAAGRRGAGDLPVLENYHPAAIPANLQGYAGNAFAGPLWNTATWKRV